MMEGQQKANGNLIQVWIVVLNVAECMHSYLYLYGLGYLCIAALCLLVANARVVEKMYIFWGVNNLMRVNERHFCIIA